MAVNSVPVNSVPLITGAIQQAARQTGVSFGYLLATAQIESNLNPSAQAPTSSAHGLYQFIEQTWLGTLKEGGAAHGYGRHADAITRLPDGRYEVADPGQRAAIMRLRSDPVASAMMAGTFARNNAAQLQSAIGRMPSEGELYIAHFLGAEGAGRLISAAANQPTARAADMFPQAAAANQRIFLDRTGRPRSASEVYATLTGRFDFARAASASPVRSAMPVVAVQPQPRFSLSHRRIRPLSPALTRWRRTSVRCCPTPSRCSRRCSPTVCAAAHGASQCRRHSGGDQDRGDRFAGARLRSVRRWPGRFSAAVQRQVLNAGARQRR